MFDLLSVLFSIKHQASRLTLYTLLTPTLLYMKLLLSALSVACLFNSVFGSELERRAKAPQVITTCKKSGTYALTFDDGMYEYETGLSKLLVQNNVTGT